MLFSIYMYLSAIQKCLVLPRKSKPVFPWHCIPATKYFVLLSTAEFCLFCRVKCLIFLSYLNKIWSSSTDFCIITVSAVTKIRPVGAVLIHTDSQTDRHEEVNRRLGDLCERAWKWNYHEYYNHGVHYKECVLVEPQKAICRSPGLNERYATLKLELTWLR